MNALTILLAAEEGGHEIDPARSPSWIFPEAAELIYGSLSSLLIFFLLWKFAGPAVKKAMAARTERIQNDLDESATAKAEATAEAADIRQAAGDIDAERSRLFADADAQAEMLLTEGRARLEEEVVELQARAELDIHAAGGRVNDELRVEVSRLASAATERVLAGGAIDAAAQQDLIESFIAKVGAA